jgi:Flp pilus assembly protein TadD
MNSKRFRLLMMGSAFALSFAMPAIAVAQDIDEGELDAIDEKPAPLPQKVEPAGAVELRDAIRRIALRPTDSYALIDAGYASLKLGDADAAFNFFTRASKLQPADPRIKAGLASAMVRRENPFEALRLFDEAARLGASERSFAMDRALAYDLLGNFERAQQDYQSARSYVQSDELTRRQAISLSLLGKSSDADAMLYPLLQRDDAEAWRARAFILASRGDSKEAEKIAMSFLSAPEARRLEYYFRQMTRLTPAQKAAALHFGHFPTGSNIGQDSEQLRIAAVASGVKPRPAAGDGRLLPTGEPLGAKGGKQRDAKKPREPKVKQARVETPRTAKRGNDGVSVSTAAAQAAIDRAATAAPRVIPANQLPPPETARPLVRIVLPAAKPPPAPMQVATVPVGLPVAVNTPPKPVPQPVAVDTKPVRVTEIRPITVLPSNQPPATSTTGDAPKSVMGELPPIGPAVGAPITVPKLPPVGPSVTPPVSVAKTVPVGPVVTTPTPTQTLPSVPAGSPTTPPVSIGQTPPIGPSAPPILPPQTLPVSPDVKPTVAVASAPTAPLVTPPSSIPADPPIIAASNPPVAIAKEAPSLPAAPAPTVATQTIAQAPVPKIDPLPPKPDVITPATVPAPVKIEPAPPPPTPAASGPGFAVLETPPAAPVSSPAPDTPKIEPVVAQGPNVDGTVLTSPSIQQAPSTTPAPVPASVPAQPAAVEVATPAPAETPKADDKGFDLGSVVESIAIPEKEQVREVAPVDLKAIKPAAPKAEEPSKTDAAKGAKTGKAAAAPARIWVQIATGTDVSALSYDYRRWAKKLPALFSGISGHSAVWGKSRRLVAGPFADMKAAKKWEAEFRKNGGDSFIWQSENGTAVEPLKSRP